MSCWWIAAQQICIFCWPGTAILTFLCVSIGCVGTPKHCSVDLCTHLFSPSRCEALREKTEHGGMNSLRVRSAGNNSAAAPASASVVVAAVSVRETERECVCVSESKLEWERVPMHCAERSWAVPCRRMASCVFSLGSRALWWGRAYGRERCGFTRISSISEDQHPAGALQSSMVGLGDPLLTPAWLMMTAHAWVTMRHSRAALGGNIAMWKWLGCQQLLDMFSRAKSGFLSAFELVFFLLVLSGCPGLTNQARTKGRWNKGGKWWTT